MKINKLILKICQLFGYRKDEVHMDDIKFKIPSVYPGWPHYEHYDFKSSNKQRIKESEKFAFYIDDVKDQVYKHLNENKKFKDNCTKANQVYVVFPNNETIRDFFQIHKTFIYIDNVLYYLGLDDVALNRAIKLKKLDV